jgi:nitrogen fixation protein FixH
MKLNWGFGIAIVYSVFAGLMVAFVIKASQQKNDLVSENYYEQAVKFQDKINARDNAGVHHVTFIFDQRLQQLTLNVEGETKNISGTIHFYKPDDAVKDFSVDLKTDASGEQIIALPKIAHGLWKLKAEWNNGGMLCYEEQKIMVQK